MLSKINNIALIIVLSFCVAGACFAQDCDCENAINQTGSTGITCLSHIIPIPNTPVGTNITVYNSVVDPDPCQNGTYYDVVVVASATSEWGDWVTTDSFYLGNQFIYNAKKLFNVPGVYSCTATFEDSCTSGPGDDLETTPLTQYAHVVGPDSITGPSEWCVNTFVQMCATYGPDGIDVNDRIEHANFLQWYWKVQGASDNTYTRFPPPGTSSYGTKSVCSIRFSTPGKYTICVKAQKLENVIYVPADWDNIVTKDVEIYGPEDVDCDSSGGGGCNTGKCAPGGQQYAPNPSLQIPEVNGSYYPNGPGGNFINNTEKCPLKPVLKMFRYTNFNSVNPTHHWHFTSPCGKTNCLNFVFNTATLYTATLGDFGRIERSGTSESNWTYIAYDGGGNKYYFGGAPTANEENLAPYLYGIDVNGNIIIGTFAPTEEENNALAMQNVNGNFSMMSTTNQTLTVVEKDPTGTIRETWTYDLSEDNEHVIQEHHPDGTTVDITYNSGGMPTEVSYSHSPTDLDFIITYGYTDGKLTSVTKGSKKILYAYVGDKITVTETNLSSSVNYSVTEYTYGTDTTTVRRIFDVNNLEEPSEEDQTTVYKYFLNALDEKTYLYSVTDPLNHITKNYTKVPTGTRLIGGTLGLNYEIVDYNSPLKGKVFKTIDAANRETEYTYDAAGLLLSIEYPEVAVYGNSNYQPTASYIYLSGTSLISLTTDISGITTYYARESTAPYRVTSVSVGGTIVKEYEYYGEYYEVNNEQVLDPRKGMLKSETVPLIDGSTDHIKTYDYFYNETTTQGTLQKLSSSPTKTYYQVWNGTTYEMVSGTYSVDIGTNSRTDTSTDADGRHILNVTNKDEQTHEKTTSTVYTEDKFTMSVYDCCNLLSTADEDGRETNYAHDAIGRVTKVWTNIDGQSDEAPLVANTYDSFGNTSVVTNRSDASTTRATSYTFDKLNRVTKIDYPGDLGDEDFRYDSMSNLLWKRDGNNKVTLYKYDALNRLTNIYYDFVGSLTEPIDYPTLASVTYLYRNGGSQLFSITDSSGTSGYTYDSMGRLASYTPPNISNRTVSYTYNNLNQKTNVTNGNFVVNYEYYANGWLKNVKKENSLIAAYIYDNVGNRTTLNYGNGSSEAFAYEETDPRYRLAGIDYSYKCDVNSNLESHGGLKFTRDNSGNPLTWGDIDNKYTKSYEYDDNSRLKSANYPGKRTTDWSYDWVGNRNNTDSEYTYNDADQLTATPDKNYEYYSNGNLHLINTDEKVFDYTYNNLVNTVTSGSNVSTMLWDNSGNKVRLTTSSNAVYDYLYDTTAGVPAVIEEVTPSNSIYYIREPNGALIARINGETTQYYHFDELGSTLFLTDSDAVVTDRYTYDAWGNVTSHTGNISQPYQYVGQLGYYTHYNDTNLPYIQTGVRLYNTEVGRYMQRDVIPIGINLYLYVFNSPILSKDPSGLAAWYEYNDINGPAYSHAWIEFEGITCQGANGYGFWSNGIRDNITKTKGKRDSYYGFRDNNVEKRNSNGDIVFERFLCDCIKQSQKKKPKYSKWPLYVCGSWLKDMWNCASKQDSDFKDCISKATKASDLKKCSLPKTPPGGD